MKKLILPLTAVTITGASVSGVVSCVKPGWTQGEIGERVVLITDSGRIHDKSFNQSSYEAIIKYSDQAPYTDTEHGVDYGGFDFKNRGLSAEKNYVEPLTTDSFSLISAYKIAAIKGTDILVLPGFMHAATVDAAAELLGPDKTVVFADSDVGTAPNIINLVYNSQLAGFAAAWDTAIWATTPTDPEHPEKTLQGDKHGHDFVSFATFGGISSKLAVDNFMWGMMVAIRYWNMRVDGTDQAYRHIYFANMGEKGEVQNADKITGTNTAFFSGSFEPSGSIKSGTTPLLYDKDHKADVIFPIAGPQTADVLSYSSNAWVIGVDTDQSKQYTSYANRFVTSAVKNLVQSIDDAIDHSKANRNNWNEDGTLMETPKVGGEYWEGGVAPAQLNWSVDVDQEENPNGSKIPKTVLDYADTKWEGFVSEMNDYYLNKAGGIAPDGTLEYMLPNRIEEMANIIATKYGHLLPLEFEKELVTS